MDTMTDSETPKVTLIGLDGVSWSLVEELLEEADVPTLESLVDSSIRGTAKSTVPSLTCPALPTLYTGKNPGELGIFDFVKPDGDIVDYTDISEPGVWDYLTEAGQSVVVGAMRTTHPAPEVNGVFISDVLSPMEESDFVTPASAQTHGERYHALREELERNKKRGGDALLETFIEMNQRRTEVLLELLEEESPDVALLWFGLTDGVQHYFWDDRQSLYEFFERFDNHLAETLDVCGDENVIVVGDHGFGPAMDTTFHLNEALHRGGFLEYSGGQVRRTLTRISYTVGEKFISDRWKRLGLKLMNKLRESDSAEANDNANGVSPTVVSPLDTLPGIDWSETRAHTSTRKGWGINLVDENVNSKEDLVEEIISYLSTLETPNGEPVIKDAWPGEELYWGRFADQIPDIIILSQDNLRVRPSLVGRLFSDYQASGGYVGSHESSRNAVFMARGPDLNDDGSDIGDVQLYDIAPMLLHLAGCAVDPGLDGTVPEALLPEGCTVSLERAPVERIRIRQTLPQLPEDRL